MKCKKTSSSAGTERGELLNMTGGNDKNGNNWVEAEKIINLT